MRLPATSTHLTYCTNIHPGDSLADVRAHIDHVSEVKRRVCPDGPFGVGLRLSAAAAEALQDPAELAALRADLAARQLYVFTLNGFPYGRFHGTRVKERVYRPDWNEDARLVYSDHLARILAALLPQDLGRMVGSVSTVPGGFRARAASPGALHAMAQRLVRHAATLWDIAAQGGPTIGLALEPEPACAFETTAELTEFFEQYIFSNASAALLAHLTGESEDRCRELLQRHLGMCLDACHAAVEFEQPADLLQVLSRASVRVLKLQVSSGLRLTAPTPQALSALSRMADDVYLHQTVVRRGDRLERYVDLPEALAMGRHGDPGDEWRVHFHVPVFEADLSALHPGFESTQRFLRELLALQSERPISEHLEVETYTWDVLPEALRTGTVIDAIARELHWTRERLGAG